MPTSNRPGDILAGRYRLDDLLSESRGARFWRAYDLVLARPVAVHVIAAADERAPLLLEAARRSARVRDRRFLRVLDADGTGTECFVVNEWGQGRSLDIVLASDGPLDPAHAAWLIGETAAALSAAHDVGVTHNRLVPENVLIDHHGEVRIIGLAVDAALNGMPTVHQATDVHDLVGCLYAALTGRWPGPSASLVPSAPRAAGNVLRPRRVRGGIPRPLDELCAMVLCPPQIGAHARAVYDLTSARGIADLLRAYVGEPTDLSDLAPAATPPALGVALPPLPDEIAWPDRDHLAEPPTEPIAAAPDASDPDTEPVSDPGGDTTSDLTTDTEGTAAPAASERLPLTEQPTEAGMPVFEESGDVGWVSARATTPAPPPPFEQPAVKPLFAPDPPAGTPVRRPRQPGAAATTTLGATPTGAGATRSSGEFWPWDTTGSAALTSSGALSLDEETDDQVPGRRWFRLALIVAAVALAFLVAMVAVNLTRGRGLLGNERDGSGSSSSTSTSAKVVTGIRAMDFDPQGDPPSENPDRAAFAVDRDPSTTWTTETYRQQLGPGGLKTGVGLVLDLGRSRSVQSVTLRMVGKPTAVSLYLTDTAPTTIDDLTPVSTDTVGRESTLTLTDAPAGRYLTVWLTALPAVQGGFRGEVAEVTVRS